jgi:hypothetical protein
MIKRILQRELAPADRSRFDMKNRYGPFLFPFQSSNRNEDGTWHAPLADRDNILGTSVDPREPKWPRWKITPAPHHEGDFVSDDPFFDIDEISGKVEFYPPGRTLRDGNLDGNPARRQRVDDLPAGNSWRRRLLVGHGEELFARDSGPRDGFERIAQPVPRPPFPGAQNDRGIPPPPNPPFVPEWLLPRPSTMTLKDIEGRPMPSQAVPGWIYDQHYWEINPSTGQRYLYKPFEPNRNPDLNNNNVPDNVEPGNPTGSYLFPALISALRQRRSPG